jgi:hypothetical protein
MSDPQPDDSDCAHQSAAELRLAVTPSAVPDRRRHRGSRNFLRSDRLLEMLAYPAQLYRLDILHGKYGVILRQKRVTGLADRPPLSQMSEPKNVGIRWVSRLPSCRPKLTTGTKQRDRGDDTAVSAPRMPRYAPIRRTEADIRLVHHSRKSVEAQGAADIMSRLN